MLHRAIISIPLLLLQYPSKIVECSEKSVFVRTNAARPLFLALLQKIRNQVQLAKLILDINWVHRMEAILRAEKQRTCWESKVGTCCMGKTAKIWWKWCQAYKERNCCDLAHWKLPTINRRLLRCWCKKLDRTKSMPMQRMKRWTKMASKEQFRLQII